MANDNESNEENKIMTTEYAWKTNRAGLYSKLTERVNEKLNTAIQELEYDGITDPIVLYFSCNTIARHFANELEEHGWVTTLDDDDEVIQVDVVGSIDQMSKDMHTINSAHYFSQDDLTSLN